jgi:hypothetical protein
VFSLLLLCWVVAFDNPENLARLEHVTRQSEALDQAAGGRGTDIEGGPVRQHLDETVSLKDEVTR